MDIEWGGNMYVIITYDVNSSNCIKAMKVLRKYLFHLHESVFEGEITDKNLKDLIEELAKKIDVKDDSIVIFKLLSDKYLRKDYVGKIIKREILL